MYNVSIRNKYFEIITFNSIAYLFILLKILNKLEFVNK
jgi:hypothetical protein